MTNTKEKTRKMVLVAFMGALIVVLQLIATMTAEMLPVNITLTLLPIVIGGILLGPAYGTALGLVFGAIVFICCAVGMDKGGALLFQANPLLCGIICFGKGAAAGFLPAFLFSKTKSFMKKSDKHYIGVTTLGAALCPIMNTGLFCLGMALFYTETLIAWAGGSPVLNYMLFGLAGINFVIEFAINVILCPLVARSLRGSRYFKHGQDNA